MAEDGAMIALGVILFLILLAVLAAVFWIWMLIDCIKRSFSKDSEKIIWILIIVLLGAIGAAVYFFNREEQKMK